MSNHQEELHQVFMINNTETVLRLFTPESQPKMNLSLSKPILVCQQLSLASFVCSHKTLTQTQDELKPKQTYTGMSATQPG